MKKLVVTFACFAFGLVFAPGLPAQPTATRIATADRAWTALQVPVSTMPLAKETASDPVARKTVLATQAAAFVAKADQAKAFYSQYAQHGKAGEAKLTEVQALVGATQAGDATVEGRLASTVQALRGDKSIPSPIRLQAVSAYGFSHQMRGRKTHEERLQAIEQVARGLTLEFPEQPQGYGSLLTIAATTGDEVRAKKIARELLDLPSPADVKDGAQKLLGRFALVGKPLGVELAGANELAAKSTLRAGRPTLVYTWATWSPGSLALAADLKKGAPGANVIGLNLDTDTRAAQAVAQKEGLVGSLIYDERGREGALAQRLKIKGAAQVFVVDAQGVIRDVRGESGLKSKLQQLGL